MAFLVVISMYALWSSVFSVGKWTLNFSPPLFLTGFRMLLAGLLILVFLFLVRRKKQTLSIKQLASLCLLGFFSTYLTNALEFWGLQYMSAAKTCFIYSLSPFFAAFFSYIHFREKMNLQKWLGLLIGFVGFIPVLMTQTGSEELQNAFAFFSWPALAVMGAALCGIYGWVLLRLFVKDDQISPPFANGVSMLFGGALALLHSLIFENWNPVPISSGEIAPFLKGALVLTLVSNIICYNLYGMLLKKFTATLLSFVGLLSPVFASLNAWVLLGETPSWIIFLSTGIVSIGLWLVYRAELRQGYVVSVEQKN